MTRLLGVVALSLLGAGCGGKTNELPPTGQVLLYIDTDAPVPTAPDALADPSKPRALVDRVRIEVLRHGNPVPNVISLAERDFVLHQGRFLAGPVSVGIAPTPGDDSLTAHVRMFLSDRVRGEEPDPNATLDAQVALPAVAAEGKVTVSLFLALQDVGKPRSPADAVPAAVGSPSRVGTSPLAAMPTCSGKAGSDEACVAGGAFWMGDPDLRGIPDIGEANQQRLVVVSPFYLDLTEVTVGSFRAFATTATAMGLALPPSWNGTDDPSQIDSYSTFTTAASSADPNDLRATLPVIGITWPTARAYCQSLGKDLPTEVQYELAATGHGAGTPYVWGTDAPSCQDAILGRAGIGYYRGFPGDCRLSGTIGSPAAPGSGQRDVLVVGNAKIVDLIGNATEWMRDVFVAQTEAPWSNAGYLQDPVVTAPGAEGDFRATRGGAWRAPWLDARAASRRGDDPDKPDRANGFRCARTP